MRHSIYNPFALLALTAGSLLAGCATIPAPLAGNDFVAVTPQQAVSQNSAAGNQRVRWGGEIINVDPRSDRTCFEILSRDLYDDARPNQRDRSDGRFLACKAGFFDPAVYTKGRDVTVVGTLGGTEQHKVGQYDYTFAKVDATEVYMWPKRTYYAGYYDPWGPCYGGGPWGWGWGGGWGPGWGGCGGLGWWGGGYYGRPIVVRPQAPPPSNPGK